MNQKKIERMLNTPTAQGIALFNRYLRKSISQATFVKELGEIIKNAPVEEVPYIVGKEIWGIVSLSGKSYIDHFGTPELSVIFLRNYMAVSIHPTDKYLRQIEYEENGYFQLDAAKKEQWKLLFPSKEGYYNYLPNTTITQTLLCIDPEVSIWLNLRRIKEVKYGEAKEDTLFIMENGLIFPTVTTRKTMNEKFRIALILTFIHFQQYARHRSLVHHLSLSEFIEIKRRPHLKNILDKIRKEDWILPSWDFFYALLKPLTISFVGSVIGLTEKQRKKLENAKFRQHKYSPPTHTRPNRQGKKKQKP